MVEILIIENFVTKEFLRGNYNKRLKQGHYGGNYNNRKFCNKRIFRLTIEEYEYLMR